MCNDWLRSSTYDGGRIMGAVVAVGIFIILLAVVTAIVEGFDLL